MKFILEKRFRGRRVVFVLVSRPERRRLRTVAAPSTAAVSAVGGLRRLGRRSGVTAGEAADALPGDETVADPMWQSTRAITIAAPPEQVWRWIVQMGFVLASRLYEVESGFSGLPSEGWLRAALEAD